MKIHLTETASGNYHALKRKNYLFSDEIGGKSPFGKELQASRHSSIPTFQAKRGAGRLEKRKSRLILYNSG